MPQGYFQPALEVDRSTIYKVVSPENYVVVVIPQGNKVFLL
jgi:hypothetical protein